MLFSEATGHKVVSTSTAATVGKVDEFVVDPGSRTVVALQLKKTDSGDTLRWANIAAFGPDAVTVTDAAAITAADGDVAALAGKDHRVHGKRVLSTIGDELGKITDVEFDAADGRIVTLLVDGRSVDGGLLIGIGSYAVVVKAGD